LEQALADGRTAVAQMNVPEFTVSPGKTLTLDMRQAHPAGADIPSRHVVTATTIVSTLRTSADGVGRLQMTDMATDAESDLVLYAGQTAGTVTHGSLTTTQDFRLVDAAHANDTAHATQAYDLAWNGSSYPASLQHRLSSDEAARLARIDVDYHNLNYPLQSRSDYEGRLPSMNGTPLFYLEPGQQRIALPVRRTDYVTPGIDWQHWFWHNPSNSWTSTQLLTIDPERYRPGGYSRQQQLAGPFTTTAQGDLDADRLQLLAYDMTDTSGNALAFDNPNGELPNWTSTLTAWRDGQQVFAGADYEGGFDTPAPTTPADWRVERDVNFPQLLTSGGVSHTVWTFHTTPVTQSSTVLPLLDVVYQIPLDAYDEAAPQRTLPVSFTLHRGASTQAVAPAAVRLQYSVDGGATWQTLPTASDQRQVTALLPAAALVPGSFVALRVTAEDHSGDSVDQTLDQAILVAAH
jgi:hypothetical protein